MQLLKHRLEATNAVTIARLSAAALSLGHDATRLRGIEDPFQHRYLDLDGVELHWAELGEPGPHPPLVLIHGLTDAHLTWKEPGARLPA